MISEETIKQIFFYSDLKRPDALLADEVDITQFADNIIAFVTPIIANEEHQRCVKIVSDMNKDVGKALHNQKPKS